MIKAFLRANLACSLYSSPVCENSEHLGLEDGSVDDNQIMASSYYSAYGFERYPYYGRLNNGDHWAMGSGDQDPWIQADFLKNVLMEGILTQGSAYEPDQEWVKMLQIQTGLSEDSITYIMEGGSPKVCFAQN